MAAASGRGTKFVNSSYSMYPRSYSCAIAGLSVYHHTNFASKLVWWYSVAYVTGSTFQTRVWEVQPHQLLVAQEPEACHAQNRAQEVLQMVQGAHKAQGG